MEKETHKTTEQQATIISISEKSLMIFLGSNYIQIRRNDGNLDIIINEKIHSFHCSIALHHAINAIVEAVDGNKPYEAVENSLWDEDGEYICPICENNCCNHDDPYDY